MLSKALSPPSRLRGGLFGVLIGAALGVPYEFHSAASISTVSAIEMTPPPHFDRAHEGVLPGTWSDDGNGSLMRCFPTIMVTTSYDEVIRLARKQSLVTHGHVRSQLCCALYCLTAVGILRNMSAADAVRAAEDELLTRQAGTPEEAELKIALDGRFDAPQGSGYVVDSFWSAIHCLLSTRNYEDCVKRAIALGNDTDTTAAIAGGLAGLLYGEAALPARWLATLQGKPIVEALLAKL